MKTKWCIYILCSVFTLSVANSKTDIYDSSSVSGPVADTSRRNILKLSTSKTTGVTLDLSSKANSESALMLTTHSFPFSPQHTRNEKLGSSRKFSSPSTIQTERFMVPKQPKLRRYTYSPNVSVTCSTSKFVVRVKQSFYGFGADADELTLGLNCKSNGVLTPYNDMLFIYHLTDCDGKREVGPGYLNYKFVLHYVPFPDRSRAHRVNLIIECRFPRYHHVYQLAVRPTWKTPTLLKQLKGPSAAFQIQLMDDTWTTPAQSQVYLLGQTVNFQVTALHLPHRGKLFIRNCYATTSNGSTSNRYTVIDNFGCMLESQRYPGVSQFVSPRTDGSLRFSLSAFQFNADPDTEVTMHCNLFVTSNELSPVQKSCTYGEQGWKALSGDDNLCDCCDSKCFTYEGRRALVEGFARSSSLLISNQPYTPKDSLPARPLPIGITYDEYDQDVFWTQTKMDERIGEPFSPEDLSEDWEDVEKYGGEEMQTYMQVKEKKLLERRQEEKTTPWQSKEPEVEEFRVEKIIESRQGSILSGELMAEGLEIRNLEESSGGEGVARSELEKEGSEFGDLMGLKSEGLKLGEERDKEEKGLGSSEGIHSLEEAESSPGSEMREEGLSEERRVAQSTMEWGAGVGEEWSLETHGELQEEWEAEGRDGSVSGEEDHQKTLSNDKEKETLIDYDGFVETSTVEGRDMVWHFKWR